MNRRKIDDILKENAWNYVFTHNREMYGPFLVEHLIRAVVPVMYKLAGEHYPRSALEVFDFLDYIDEITNEKD